jgi:hypothetical protein
MNATSRRKIEMGTSALEFLRPLPDSDAGYTLALAKLEQQVGRAQALAAAQRGGLVDVRAASARKTELRRAMLSGPIAHLAEVGRGAAQEEHELGKTFRFKPGASTFLAFRTAARSMAAEAQSHREVLVKHGLAESVLEQFVQMLDQFDAAVTLGNDGRSAHVGATRELKAVAAEIVQTVRVMDGRNRQRFQGDGQLLGAWISASTVRGAPKGAPSTPGGPSTPGTTGTSTGGTPPAGEVRPAA